MRLTAGSSPRRSSVARSSSLRRPTGCPCRRAMHTGSAPQTPIRQPASIRCSAVSATSSSAVPGLASTRGPPSSNVTSGSLCPASAAARAGAEPGAPPARWSRRLARRTRPPWRTSAGATTDGEARRRRWPPARRDPRVEEDDRGRAVDGRELGRAHRQQRLEREERAGARADGERHPRVVLGHARGVRVRGREERDHEAREGAGEQLARRAPLAVVVVEIGEEGDARVEVVAVLRAADARACSASSGSWPAASGRRAAARAASGTATSTSRSCPSAGRRRRTPRPGRRG